MNRKNEVADSPIKIILNSKFNYLSCNRKYLAMIMEKFKSLTYTLSVKISVTDRQSSDTTRVPPDEQNP